MISWKQILSNIGQKLKLKLKIGFWNLIIYNFNKFQFNEVSGGFPPGIIRSMWGKNLYTMFKHTSLLLKLIFDPWDDYTRGFLFMRRSSVLMTLSNQEQRKVSKCQKLDCYVGHFS